MRNPLVTFTLLSYNQEAYIAEAVLHALEQTYAPLEIIISDDSSTDRTYEIIREVVRSHANGTATIRPYTYTELPPDASPSTPKLPSHDSSFRHVCFRRNAVNEGIILHCHRVFEMAHGELIVPSAGDDYSVPDRTEKVVLAWLATGKKAAAILHQARKVDPDGKILGPLPQQSLEAPLGCGTNYRRDLITDFPPVTVKGSADDWVYVRRARLVGTVAFLPDELVRYRVGCGVSSVFSDNRGPALRSQKGIVKSMEQCAIDLESVRTRIDPETYEQHRHEIAAAKAKAEAYVSLLTASTVGERFRAWRQIAEPRLKGRILQAIYILPPPVADCIIRSYLKLKKS